MNAKETAWLEYQRSRYAYQDAARTFGLRGAEDERRRLDDAAQTYAAECVAEAREPLVAALEAVEWGGTWIDCHDPNEYREDVCPSCGGWKEKGHAPDCQLAAALAKPTPRYLRSTWST
jgi:hypothetical protein